MKRAIICGLALVLPLLLASCVVHVHEHPGPRVDTGYDATVYGYYYYPSSYVYYDPVDRVYFYISSSGVWTHGAVLPRTIVINQRERVTVKLAGKKPYHHWQKHYKKHPPKKLRIAPGQLKRKDRERARKAVLDPKIKTKLKVRPGQKKFDPKVKSVTRDALKRGERGKGKGKKEEIEAEDKGKVKKKKEKKKVKDKDEEEEEEEEVEKEEGKGKKEKEDKKEEKDKKDKKLKRR